MDPINPSVIALHGALVEITLRLNRVEQKLHMPDAPLATFAQPGSNIPAPCSCDESLALRARVRTLEEKLVLLEPIGGPR